FGPVCRRRWTTGQRRTASIVNGQWELPIDGHENCPAAATISACLETPFSLVLWFWLVETASRSVPRSQSLRKGDMRSLSRTGATVHWSRTAEGPTRSPGAGPATGAAAVEQRARRTGR